MIVVVRMINGMRKAVLVDSSGVRRVIFVDSSGVRRAVLVDSSGTMRAVRAVFSDSVSLKKYREPLAFRYFMFLSAKIARDVRLFVKAIGRVVIVSSLIEIYETYGTV